MRYILNAPDKIDAAVRLPASKSISNRALVMNALAGSKVMPDNLSDCDDTRVILDALRRMPETIDIGAAGTAMRFMTAYLAVTPGCHTLTGTERMKHRPIRALVDALRYIGADIAYEGDEGYPPLRINGRRLEGGRLDIPGDISSQYISALLMVGPVLERGLELRLTGEIISRPYIDLTLCMMRGFGADAEWGAAGWADANGVPVALNIWPTLPTALSQAAVTASAPVTLTTNPYVTRVGSLIIGASEHTLTLAGSSGLTVEEALTLDGPLATSVAVLPLPSAVTLNAPLTYAVPQGQTVELPSLLSGTETFVKTGAGTLAFPNTATATAPIHLQEGTLAFSTDSSPAPYATIPDIVAEGGTTVTLQEAFIQLQDAEATITLRNNATFCIYNGNSWASRPIAPTFLIENDGAPENAAHIQGSSNGQFAAFTGALQGHGLLILDGGNANQYNIACPIRDDGEGTLTLRFADDNSLIHLTSEGSYTGGTEIASRVSIGTSGGTVSAKAAPDALGRGPVAIEAGGTLTIADNTTLNLYAAFANAGTLTGAIRLCDGATLMGGETACFDAVSVAEGATVTVTAPEGTEAEAKLVSWTEGKGPADATGFAVAGWEVEARTDGLYVTAQAPAGPTLPETAEGDDSGATFNDLARTLLEQAATAAGLSEVTAVSGVANGRPMTTEELNVALPILQGEGLVTVEGTALRVAYDFTVTTLTVDGGNVAVTATLSAPNGGTVAFGPMAIKAELIPVSLAGDGAEEGEPLETQNLTPATAEAPVTALSSPLLYPIGCILIAVQIWV